MKNLRFIQLSDDNSVNLTKCWEFFFFKKQGCLESGCQIFPCVHGDTACYMGSLQNTLLAAGRFSEEICLEFLEYYYLE